MTDGCREQTNSEGRCKKGAHICILSNRIRQASFLSGSNRFTACEETSNRRWRLLIFEGCRGAPHRIHTHVTAEACRFEETAYCPSSSSSRPSTHQPEVFWQGPRSVANCWPSVGAWLMPLSLDQALNLATASVTGDRPTYLLKPCMSCPRVTRSDLLQELWL